MQTRAQLREHYEIERELSDRLRQAGSREERRRLYGVVYRELSERIAHHPLVVLRDDHAARSLAIAPQMRLLRGFVTADCVFCEIGAGDGALARALAPCVRSSMAFDVTDAMLSGPSPAGNFRFRVFDGLDSGLAAGSVDVAYSHDVVEHLHPADMLEQTREVARMLRPGGVYVCVTPNRLWGPHDVSRHFSDSAEGFHLHEYTATELIAVLRRADFRQVRVLLSVGGRRLTPLLPWWLVMPVEKALAGLPRRLRLVLGRGLAAVKVVGIR